MAGSVVPGGPPPGALGQSMLWGMLGPGSPWDLGRFGPGFPPQACRMTPRGEVYAGQTQRIHHPVREGFLKYAAGAEARKEFQAEGTTYQREGAKQFRLCGMEWGKEWIVLIS